MPAIDFYWEVEFVSGNPSVEAVSLGRDGDGPFTLTVTNLEDGPYEVFVDSGEDGFLPVFPGPGLDGIVQVIGGVMSGIYLPPIKPWTGSLPTTRRFVFRQGDTDYTPETETITYYPRSFRSRVLSLRKLLPSHWRLGVRDPGSDRYPQK